jgi:hypothetical protein
MICIAIKSGDEHDPDRLAPGYLNSLIVGISGFTKNVSWEMEEVFGKRSKLKLERCLPLSFSLQGLCAFQAECVNQK